MLSFKSLFLTNECLETMSYCTNWITGDKESAEQIVGNLMHQRNEWPGLPISRVKVAEHSFAGGQR